MTSSILYFSPYLFWSTASKFLLLPFSVGVLFVGTLFSSLDNCAAAVMGSAAAIIGSAA